MPVSPHRPRVTSPQPLLRRHTRRGLCPEATPVVPTVAEVVATVAEVVATAGGGIAQPDMVEPPHAMVALAHRAGRLPKQEIPARTCAAGMALL